ncbi:MAG: enoyl-CoA hydratase/isomerase family protein [Alphaproteobacteria bacterium]
MFRLAIEERTAVVTLSHPPVNAIGGDWIATFGALLDRIERDDAVAVLHVRSDQTVFCAGTDLRQIDARFSRDGGHRAFADEVGGFQYLFQHLFRRIETLPVATVAEIGGSDMGGGLELALACDLRIAADDAWLGLPEVTIGLVPGTGGTRRLSRLCGPGTASRMILTGDPVRGAEALRLGLVQWAVPRADLPELAAKLAARLAGLSPPALRACKARIADAARPGDEGFERSP